jgi:aspartyl-tRNA(Asn)/glutamyl-tRNA(Gln) amidotransferase subunit C
MDKETVVRVARTAHLALTDEEIERFSADLGEILDWFKVLDEAPGHDGVGVNPTPVSDVMRDDEPSQEYSQPELLKDMKTYDQYVRGPKLA